MHFTLGLHSLLMFFRTKSSTELEGYFYLLMRIFFSTESTWMQSRSWDTEKCRQMKILSPFSLPLPFLFCFSFDNNSSFSWFRKLQKSRKVGAGWSNELDKDKSHQSSLSLVSFLGDIWVRYSLTLRTSHDGEKELILAE